MSLDAVASRAGVSVSCIQTIARWESCLKKIGPDAYGPYLCPARVATIGYGTTVYNEIGKKVSLADRPITKERAEELLAFDIGRVYAPAVDKLGIKWQHENQRAACISFAYNVGTYGFAKSTLCWLLKQGQYDRAAEEFLKWTRGGGRVLPGLVNRRRDERKLFLTPTTAKTAAADTEPRPSVFPPATSPGFFRTFLKWLGRT